MDAEYVVYFLLFVLANSIWMYRAGQREGRFDLYYNLENRPIWYKIIWRP